MNPLLLKATRAYQAGQMAEAIEICQCLPASLADSAHAWRLRGLSLWGLGRPAEALPALQSAANRCAPGSSELAEVLHDWALVCLALQQAETAIPLLQHGLALLPNAWPLWRSYAQALQDSGRLNDALEALEQQRALLSPEPFAQQALERAWIQTTFTAIALERWPLAAEAVAQARQLAPESPAVWTAGGFLALRQDDPAGAVHAFEMALARTPETEKDAHASRLSALGAALFDCGRYEDALAACSEGVALAPADPVGRQNRAAALLVYGALGEGWQDLSYRWQTPVFQRRYRPAQAPEWDQAAHPTETLLVRCEQAFGDALMMARYLPLLAQRFEGSVIVECHPPLQRLFSSLPGVAQVISFEGPLGEPWPNHHWQIPLFDLPRFFDGLPPPAACLPAQPISTDYRIPAGNGPAIGFCWAGRPQPRNRSVPFAALWQALQAARAELPTRWVCLQADEHRQDAAECSALWMPPPPRDFADSAAVIQQLDFVVCIDSAVLHLAAACGVPSAALLLHGADWRYGLPAPAGQAASPWYPQTALFRQPAQGNWDGALKALGEWLSKKV